MREVQLPLSASADGAMIAATRVARRRANAPGRGTGAVDSDASGSYAAPPDARSEPPAERRQKVSAPLERTKTPGIYARGSRYVVIYRDPSGRQRKRSARTLAEARDLKATLRADVTRGEYRQLSRVSFVDYARSWITTYHGRTSRGIRPETLSEYAADLGVDVASGEPLDPARGAIAFFGRMQMSAIEPRDVKEYAAEVAKRGVAPGTVRLAIAPVRALLATAFEEGVIRSNPAAALRIAQRVEESSEPERAKALTEKELKALLAAVRCRPCQTLEEQNQPPCVDCATCADWRLLLEFLAHTGLRISEALALRWQEIDFGHRRVLVRRRLRGRSFAPPKSRYGRRDVPLAAGMARSLWELRKHREAREEAPVFASRTGGYLDAANVFSRVLKPAAQKGGVPWAGFHTLRHSCATLLFLAGFNAKQVQVWLGHHSPAFTLATYAHLLPDDLPEPKFLDKLTAPERGNRVATKATETDRTAVAGSGA
jgi:integrase